jgi:hypothetical protein
MPHGLHPRTSQFASRPDRLRPVKRSVSSIEQIRIPCNHPLRKTGDRQVEKSASGEIADDRGYRLHPRCQWLRANRACAPDRAGFAR